MVSSSNIPIVVARPFRLLLLIAFCCQLKRYFCSLTHPLVLILVYFPASFPFPFTHLYTYSNLLFLISLLLKLHDEEKDKEDV